VDGGVLAVKFVRLRGESAILNWDVPLDDSLRTAAGVGRPATEAVELPAPTVTVGRAAKKARGSGDR
jgi:hypothetical protein